MRRLALCSGSRGVAVAVHSLLALLAVVSTSSPGLAQQQPPAQPGTPPHEPRRQEPGEPRPLFTDETGAFDVSGFLSTRVGFLPLAVPITEPAVGYGLALGLAYFHHEPPVVDEATGPRTIMPSTTVLLGAATESGTWATGLAHLGIWDEGRTRYLGALGHANLELDWYGRDDALDGRSIAYTNEADFVLQSVKLQLGESRFFLGPQYEYFGSDATFDPSALDPGVAAPELRSKTSGLGVLLGYDDLDHPYQPSRGVKAELALVRAAQWLGGDFDYTQARSYLIDYVPLSERFVLGLRANLDVTAGRAPFYDLPTVVVRGLPRTRYVDENAAYGEAELRWDFAERWTAVAFAGGGSVGESLDDLGEAAFAGGAGARYLIASRYGLRLGADVAYGEDEWTVYVGFGTGWVRP